MNFFIGMFSLKLIRPSFFNFYENVIVGKKKTIFASNKIAVTNVSKKSNSWRVYY
jgi:hypothetical protein